MPEQRKKQMNSAIKLTILFLALYGISYSAGISKYLD